VFQTNLYCYLWDLVDEGIEQVLDQLKGEAGITGITVAVHHPGVDQLRPHTSASPRRFRSAGGAQFQPDTARYRSTRMRPVVAEWLHKRNPLKAVADACAKRALTLRAWAVCCQAAVTAARYETSCLKDVLEQPSKARLCPSNLDVREYLAAMVEDLSENYPFDAIELEQAAFPADLSSSQPGKIGFACGETGDWLRSLCFCESCRQLATRDGIDVTAAANVAREHLEHLLATGEPLTLPVAQFAAENPALQRFVDFRCKQITSLVRIVKRSCRCPLVIHRSGDRFRAATVFPEIAAHCDALLAKCHETDVSSMTQLVRAAAEDAGGIERVELSLSACTPPCPDSATLVASMKQAAELGVRSVSVANYGLIPMSRLEWIRQASRYAQREAR